ncbi:hypothetical protein OH77DRAFT_1518678 [Trametes cingulata]|nr:hypothetical protein OH77DRAFT_1518678 [Trametes cingulata]
MASPRTIQVIQEIKDSVEKPHRCGWLENMQSDESKRVKARRYRDGAVKIMDLLRPELTASDITSYERYYDDFHAVPETWANERLSAAKALWEYVLSLDEWLSHERITSVPRHRAPSRPTYREDAGRRRRHHSPERTNTPASPPPANNGQGYAWWPSTYYTPTWLPSWSPGYVATSYSPPAYVSYTPYWPGTPPYLRAVWA